MTSIEVNNIKICFDEETLRFTLYKKETEWKWKEFYRPYFEYEGGSLEFADAEAITHEEAESGLGKGIRSRYWSPSLPSISLPFP